MSTVGLYFCATVCKGGKNLFWLCQVAACRLPAEEAALGVVGVASRHDPFPSCGGVVCLSSYAWYCIIEKLHFTLEQYSCESPSGVHCVFYRSWAAGAEYAE